MERCNTIIKISLQNKDGFFITKYPTILKSPKYRIEEYCGVFTIYVRGYKWKGMFWWQKKEWDWYKCNKYGGIVQTYHTFVQPSCKSFNSLEKAKDRVNQFKKGATYHNI